jgi:hypothetical protein
MKFGPKALLPLAVLVGALAASAALVVERPIPVALPCRASLSRQSRSATTRWKSI